MVLPVAGETGWATKLNDHITGLHRGGQQFRVGNWYGIFRSISGLYDTFALVTNRLYLNLFVVSEATTFDQICMTVGTVAEATKVARLGIYKCERGVPTTLVLDAGTVSLGTTGQKSLTISQTLQPGVYFLVCTTNATTANARAVSANVDGFRVNPGQSVGDWHDGNVVADCWYIPSYDPTLALPATAVLTGITNGHGVSRDALNINVRAA